MAGSMLVAVLAALSSNLTNVNDVSDRLARMLVPIMGAALLSLFGALAVDGPEITAVLGTIGFALLFVGVASFGWRSLRSISDARLMEALKGFVEKEESATILTSAEGVVLHVNAVTRSKFQQTRHTTIGTMLNTRLANPSAVLYRLQTRATGGETAAEDIVTRAGHMRLSVQQIGRNGLLWRMDERRAEDDPTLENDRFPIFSFGRGGIVLYMNESARCFVGTRLRNIAELVEDPPIVSGSVHKIMTHEGPVRRLVTMIEAGMGRTEVILLPDPEDISTSNLDEISEFDTVPVPLLRLSADGVVLRANDKACQLLHHPDPGGSHVSDLMQGLGRPIRDWIAEAAGGQPRNLSEFLKVSRGDKEVFIQVTLTRHVAKQEVFLTAVLSDATELKSLEAQFVQSQKMQAIGQLAGGVAHDFNNLLTAISGHCDLLLLRHDSGDPDYADLVQINQNANRAASLVGQLLAFSRKQTLHPELIDMRDTLSDLTHLLNRLVGEKVRLLLTHDPMMMQVRVDKRQLEQVLMNLVVNARDAMPAGGEIRIETGLEDIAEPMQRDDATVPPGKYVVVHVTDEGVGIPSDKLPKVFEPFYTTKRTGEGTGLGLSTAYGIVKQTGGFIFVESEVGRGTRFSLYFPAHERTPQNEPAVPMVRAKSAQRQGSGVVLLVEDEAPVRAFASRALRLRGYTVIEAATAEEALELLDDRDLVVDIFVTDVVMPGLDGPTWVRRAREDRPDVQVVFVSGYAEDVFDSEDGDIPNSVFLPKPFSLTQLTETVRQRLN